MGAGYSHSFTSVLAIDAAIVVDANLLKGSYQAMYRPR